MSIIRAKKGLTQRLRMSSEKELIIWSKNLFRPREVFIKPKKNISISIYNSKLAAVERRLCHPNSTDTVAVVTVVQLLQFKSRFPVTAVPEQGAVT